MVTIAPDTNRPQPRPRGARIPLAIGQRRFSRSYGRVVGGLKVILPTVAVALILMVFIWPYLEKQGENLVGALGNITGLVSENLEVNEASYSGVGDDGMRYTLTADKVKQTSLEATEVTFSNPQADVSLSDGSWALISSDAGLFDRSAEILELSGAVTLYHDEGYEFRTESATMDLLSGNAFGFDPVAGQGPFGFVEAEGFEIHNRGERVLLTGRAKIVTRASN